jgi:hypothetical protein
MGVLTLDEFFYHHTFHVYMYSTHFITVEVNTSGKQFFLILIAPPPLTALSMKSCGGVKHTFNQAADLAK